jgi:hypothetical protein
LKISESSLPSSSSSSDALTFVEKLVEARLLVLVLSLLFYIDIWAIKKGIDPSVLTIDQVMKQIFGIPIFTIVIFFVSYSMLVGSFFPLARLFGGMVWVHSFSKVAITKKPRSLSEQRLSDWSLTVVVLSIFDFFAGHWSTSAYKGFAVYLFQFLEGSAMEAIFFRLPVILFLITCLIFAAEIDFE